MSQFDPVSFKDKTLTVRSVWEGATLEGLYVKPLKTLVDGRGDITEIWSESWKDDNILPINHAYYNLTDPGIIKGWHWHENSYSQYVCLQGKMQIVLIDLRVKSKTFGEVNQFLVSSKNPLLIKIPPMVLKGWKALEDNGVIINLINTPDVKDNKKVPVETFLSDIWQPIFG